jgi:hypothetical protein
LILRIDKITFDGGVPHRLKIRPSLSFHDILEVGSEVATWMA